LLAGLGGGDAELAVAFVRRFQHTVFGLALAVVGESRLAEDIAQQTFERAWRHAQTYDPRQASVRTWLAAITRHLAIDTIRTRRPIPVDPGDLIVLITTGADTPEGQAIAAETLAELRAAVAALPSEQARALVMAAIHGMTAADIAGVEHIPLGTAKTRIRTAMRRLHGTLSAQPGADHE
jgi:RNA polymerase sigma-70 factor (ECF subfamily)